MEKKRIEIILKADNVLGMDQINSDSTKFTFSPISSGQYPKIRLSEKKLAGDVFNDWKTCELLKRVPEILIFRKIDSII